MFKLPKEKTRILNKGEGKINLCPSCGDITYPINVENKMFNDKFGYICEECHSIWHVRAKISLKEKMIRLLSIIGR